MRLIVLFGLLTIIGCHGLIENDPYTLRVAFKCNKVPKYYNQTSKTFMDDERGITMCPQQNKTEILGYCRKIYKEYHVVNIVNDDMKQHFDNWCDEGKKSCRFKDTSRVYRCVVGRYFSHAVSIKQNCKFDYVVDNKGVCKDEDVWVKIAKERCNEKGRDRVVGDYSPLEYKSSSLDKCDYPDQFRGIQFSCCDRKHEHKPTEIPQSNNFFPNGTCDSTTFSYVRKALLKRRNERLQQLLKRLKNDVHMSLSARNATTTKFLAKTRELLLRLHQEHYVCAYKIIEEKKKLLLESLTTMFNSQNVDLRKLTKVVHKIARIFRHEHHFLVRQFFHLKHLSPEHCEHRRLQDLMRLQAIVSHMTDLANVLKNYPKLKDYVLEKMKALIIPKDLHFPIHEIFQGKATAPSNEMRQENREVIHSEKTTIRVFDESSKKKSSFPSTLVGAIISAGFGIIVVIAAIIAAVIKKAHSKSKTEEPKVPLIEEKPKRAMKIGVNQKFKFYEPEV